MLPGPDGRDDTVNMLMTRSPHRPELLPIRANILNAVPATIIAGDVMPRFSAKHEHNEHVIRKARAMNFLNIATAALFSVTTGSALAQAPGLNVLTDSQPNQTSTPGNPLSRSGAPGNQKAGTDRAQTAPPMLGGVIGQSADAMGYLKVARAALTAGKASQAVQSLEMAETRLLDRSVPEGQTDIPLDNATIMDIRAARLAAGKGDRKQAITLIDVLLAR